MKKGNFSKSSQYLPKFHEKNITNNNFHTFNYLPLRLNDNFNCSNLNLFDHNLTFSQHKIKYNKTLKDNPSNLNHKKYCSPFPAYLRENKTEYNSDNSKIFKYTPRYINNLTDVNNIRTGNSETGNIKCNYNYNFNYYYTQNINNNANPVNNLNKKENNNINYDNDYSSRNSKKLLKKQNHNIQNNKLNTIDSPNINLKNGALYKKNIYRNNNDLACQNYTENNNKNKKKKKSADDSPELSKLADDLVKVFVDNNENKNILVNVINNSNNNNKTIQNTNKSKITPQLSLKYKKPITGGLHKCNNSGSSNRSWSIKNNFNKLSAEYNLKEILSSSKDKESVGSFDLYNQMNYNLNKNKQKKRIKINEDKNKIIYFNENDCINEYKIKLNNEFFDFENDINMDKYYKSLKLKKQNKPIIKKFYRQDIKINPFYISVEDLNEDDILPDFYKTFEEEDIKSLEKSLEQSVDKIFKNNDLI